MAFIRSLLESLGRNNNGSEEELSSRRPFPVKPSLINLIENNIKELKSLSNDKGYMLIATVPNSERIVVIDLLQREVIIVSCWERIIMSSMNNNPGPLN